MPPKLTGSNTPARYLIRKVLSDGKEHAPRDISKLSGVPIKTVYNVLGPLCRLGHVSNIRQGFWIRTVNGIEDNPASSSHMDYPTYSALGFDDKSRVLSYEVAKAALRQFDDLIAVSDVTPAGRRELAHAALARVAEALLNGYIMS